mgnify:CR=1 FL=1
MWDFCPTPATDRPNFHLPSHPSSFCCLPKTKRVNAPRPSLTLSALLRPESRDATLEPCPAPHSFEVAILPLMFRQLSHQLHSTRYSHNLCSTHSTPILTTHSPPPASFMSETLTVGVGTPKTTPVLRGQFGFYAIAGDDERQQ